ncbi:MAG: hypothetical protein KDD60_02410 [Bdellovibrionales bacterium]|nr:hypothetical protein [Bdellovibrionales bacterium]
MKLLISCVNSPQSLIGYDLDKRETFWRLESEGFKACGISYFRHGLLVSSDNRVLHFGPEAITHTVLQGPHNPLAHSIHPLSPELFGVVDTGHSAVRVYDANLQLRQVMSPLAAWPHLPEDAIHLNDFVVTPFGMFASCFDYRPWRENRKQRSFQEWCSGGYGLILNLTGYSKEIQNGEHRINVPDHSSGRIVQCGLNHPHSLTLSNGNLYYCSSATGQFHRSAFLQDGGLRETGRFTITQKHFLRGAYRSEKGWILGGSSSRHGQTLTDTIALYLFDEDSMKAQEVSIPLPGEIYDILPWKEEIMNPVQDLIAKLTKK